VIHVVTAVITAERENMNTSIVEETGTAQAPATGEKPKATKKARVAPQGAHVGRKKGSSVKKATPAKKAPKAAGGREGSKTNTILDLLKRAGGVTAKELMVPGPKGSPYRSTTARCASPQLAWQEAPTHNSHSFQRRS
jgi:hypothetical protein